MDYVGHSMFASQMDISCLSLRVSTGGLAVVVQVAETAKGAEVGDVVTAVS